MFRVHTTGDLFKVVRGICMKNEKSCFGRVIEIDELPIMDTATHHRSTDNKRRYHHRYPHTMIIPANQDPDNVELPDKDNPEPVERPPNYSPSPVVPARQQPQTPTKAGLRARPSNFLYLIRKHQPIKDTFLIDPSLRIPAPLLPPLGEDEPEAERRNLKLSSATGNIDVEIHLVGGEEGGRPTMVDLYSEHGYMEAKLYAPERATRAPFHLSARTMSRSLTLHLPRSFHGLLTITTVHRSHTLSDQLAEHVTTFGEVDSTRRCFVGDFSSWGGGEGGGVKGDREWKWDGDEVEVYSSTGKVKIQFVDEAAVVVEGVRKKGFFGALMSAVT